MIDPDVRTAEPGDVAQLVDLEEEARSALVDQRGGRAGSRSIRSSATAWLERLASDTVFVARIDDVLVGYAVVVDDGPDDQSGRPGLRDCRAPASSASATRCWRPAWRTRASAAHSVFEGEALPGDRDTKNLYERAGITARLITVSTRLDR